MPAILPGTTSTPLIRHEGGGVESPEGIRGAADQTSGRPGVLEPVAGRPESAFWSGYARSGVDAVAAPGAASDPAARRRG
ncbi:hypothetical protein [Streptomyces incanus]